MKHPVHRRTLEQSLGIKSIPNIIQLSKKGGEGVVRELVELILP